MPARRKSSTRWSSSAHARATPNTALLRKVLSAMPYAGGQREIDATGIACGAERLRVRPDQVARRPVAVFGQPPSPIEGPPQQRDVADPTHCRSDLPEHVAERGAARRTRPVECVEGSAGQHHDKHATGTQHARDEHAADTDDYAQTLRAQASTLGTVVRHATAEPENEVRSYAECSTNDSDLQACSAYNRAGHSRWQCAIVPRSAPGCLS